MLSVSGEKPGVGESVRPELVRIKKKDRGYSGTLYRNSLLEWGIWALPGKGKFP